MENVIEQSALRQNKNKMLHYGAFILIVVGLFYLTELLRFADPLFEHIYYGNLVDFFINILKGICYLTITILAMGYSKKHFKLNNIYDSKKRLPIKRVFLLYCIVIGIIFIVTASLNFKVKIVVDLGSNITGATLMKNISNIVLGIIRMALVIVVIRHSQEFFELLINKNWAKNVPFGGIVAMILIGTFVLVISGVSLINIVLYFMYIVYGELYLLSYRYFPTSYVSAMLIQLL